MTKLSNKSLWEISRNVWKKAQEDELLGRAAELSFYFLFALFPMLIFLTTLFGYLAGSGAELHDEVMTVLARIVPASALVLVRETFREIIEARSGGKLSFGLLVALWVASTGVAAINQSLNRMFDVKETRPWWKTRLIAIFLTIALSALVVFSLLLVLFGHQMVDYLSMRYYAGDLLQIAGQLMKWPVALLLMLIAVDLIYFVGPNTKRSWRFFSTGALFAVGFWLLISLAFRQYLSFFDRYSATYGSLGTLIVLMLWFYLTGLAILLGAEVDSELSVGKRFSRSKKFER